MTELTLDTAYRELQDILREKILLVVGTGASMALDTDFGMNALSQELLKTFGGNTTKQWKEVRQKLDDGADLESALKEVDDESLIKEIVRVTGNFVAGVDREAKQKILENEEEVPIEHFIQKLVNGLPEFAPVLDIITPNYDLLIEHACDKMEIPYVNGFCGGIRKYEDWNKAALQMLYIKTMTMGRKRVKVERMKKHIRLYKVHGSLNWFINEDNDFSEDNSMVYSGSSLERFIVTPGDRKYRKTYKNFKCFAESNRAVGSASAFVLVGYGFNDDHIQQEIEKELIKKKKTGIIITRELSKKAEELLEKTDTLWAVYWKSKKYGEAVNDSEALIYNKSYKNPFQVENCKLWDIQTFSRGVLGD